MLNTAMAPASRKLIPAWHRGSARRQVGRSCCQACPAVRPAQRAAAARETHGDGWLRLTREKERPRHGEHAINAGQLDVQPAQQATVPVGDHPKGQGLQEAEATQHRHAWRAGLAHVLWRGEPRRVDDDGVGHLQVVVEGVQGSMQPCACFRSRCACAPCSLRSPASPTFTHRHERQPEQQQPQPGNDLEVESNANAIPASSTVTSRQSAGSAQSGLATPGPHPPPAGLTCCRAAPASLQSRAHPAACASASAALPVGVWHRAVVGKAPASGGDQSRRARAPAQLRTCCSRCRASTSSSSLVLRPMLRC
jgi:hypothetical protein